MPDQVNVQLAEQELAEPADGDPHRGLARAGSFQDIAGILARVLDHARQVGMAGTRLGHRRQVVDLEILVVHAERDRGPDRFTQPNPGQDLDAVGLDLHPSAAAVSLLAPTEIAVDGFLVELDPGREPFHHADQALSVGLAGGEIS